jgi:hypothetical protein
MINDDNFFLSQSEGDLMRENFFHGIKFFMSLPHLLCVAAAAAVENIKIQFLRLLLSPSKVSHHHHHHAHCRFSANEILIKL